ncbi:MAG: pyruvate:ferredoxin (flavodoxin) oxidoreductase [Oscillospiraceae bacterium]|nr:pyruvate:ferredoxin (flavodoxin) oxidoreductase [Oscillospiraceae bacterium]
MADKKYVTMDGNEAAAYIAYAFTEVAAIYPITPSSPMAGKTDVWSAQGRKNIFGQTVKLVEMQAESGAIAAVHGAVETGALATSYTSSQGLMLMIPTMYRIAGERHPAVLHVAARTVGTHALSIFGDHSDIYACRQTGWGMIASSSVQEVMDLAGVAHLSAIKGRVPFMHFFDGFRTSHEIAKVEQISYDDLAKMVDMDDIDRFRAHALNPEHPMIRATVQNSDIYFQVREANNTDYFTLPDIVEAQMEKINAVTGRNYHAFNYYGDPDAERVIVAMGSVCSCIEEVVDHLCAKGEKVGAVQVHLFRPFDIKRFIASLPASCKAIAVLDRTKEMGSAGEPLYQDVCTALFGRSDVKVVGGRYGLSSKDTTPAQIAAVFENLRASVPVNSFTIGINDDVTHLSLPEAGPLYFNEGGVVSCKFWGLGGDGTVGANHDTVNIINTHTSKFAQAYFEYDAKKSFGVTKSHLRFGDLPIRSSYFVKQADFLACHTPTYIESYDIAEEVKPGGTLLLNCSWDMDGLEKHLPAKEKRYIAANGIKLYTIDAIRIAGELGLGRHTNMVLQSAFFNLMPVIPVEQAVGYMKDACRKRFFAKGEDVVNKNLAAIDAGAEGLVRIDVPAEWANAEDEARPERSVPKVVTEIADPINAQKGDDLPVSAFKGYEDGVMDMGLTAFEKRGIATTVPVWDPAKCLQCNKCAYVCPHAVIRPYLLSAEEAAAAPEGIQVVPAKGKTEGLSYSLQVSALDCTSCGSCVNVCPAKEKAISMVSAEAAPDTSLHWEYALTLSDKGDVFDPYTVKGSQFRQPLLEFSAACAGCGETPYAKLLTQLYGDRVYWANATGCSQAWGSAMPGIPYTCDKCGHGVAWTNSLFENNAEFSLGMVLSVGQQRDAVKTHIMEYREKCTDEKILSAIDGWLDTYDDFDKSKYASLALADALSRSDDPEAAKLLRSKDQFTKKTFWMFGGDGWAYDIGFGGLDHVVASGADVNVLVVDTEIYSNTGGQSSKATQIGAVAQFAAAGKDRPKKDLGAMLMTYGNVYVASVAMGADNAQLIKAVKEAQSFKGPSIIIAYAPCQSHGLKCGMAKVQDEMKRAVDSGYWTLYRYDPRLKYEGKNPFTLDSKAPTMPYSEFLDGEVRFASLRRTFPDNADKLFAEGEEYAKQHFEELKART